MKVQHARTNASEWVYTHARHVQGYSGAYFSGSIIGLSEQDDLAPSSDVDIVVITEDEPPFKLGKFIYKGTLLEVTYLTWKPLSTVEKVLSSYHLAGSFRVDTIIDDPTGRLRSLQKAVSQHFYQLEWVRRRCLNAREKVENGLRSINRNAAFHEQVTSWLFPTGVITHIILVAALENPTVRKRYLKTKEVLINYGYETLYEDLLDLVGCAHWHPQQVQLHLEALRQTFDKTVEVAKTPFFFSSDITEESRPIAISGSQSLIDSGHQREAVFWIIATFARCHTILAVDAPSLHHEYFPFFQAAVGDLGVFSTDDLLERAERARQFLPPVWTATEDILDKNPLIQR
ncbi:hypothetical protein [Lederbergia galactosidilytica]|uniref:Polymerase nucleotidyl transferase domain-containing protein n=1 Tax=Lederbergia galactosidilytica TaxID=217031 RepID=A0A178A136_9BACI|nr:hypothetical protein [Lederbergia galactosidilytica]KRG13152.1 hypothetical protein ACA30_16230 [Virgibacillus soli]OAK73529.1 hypothetical protein ABB05_06775 [Lederbergia galactosidilytica]